MRSAWTVAAALALFWSLVLLGGALEPGYSHREDYVSRLASSGAAWPAVGIVAIASLASAHAAAALVLRRLGAVTAASALGAAALAGYVVAAFRIHCPGGAAGCRGGSAARTWTDAVHGYAVAGYEVALVMAMLAAAWWWARRGRTVAAVGHGLLAVASLLTLLRVEEPAAGADQRLWLAVSTAWLLVVVVDSVRAVRARRRR